MLHLFIIKLHQTIIRECYLVLNLTLSQFVICYLILNLSLFLKLKYLINFILYLTKLMLDFLIKH